MTNKIRIIKRDDRIVDFDREKIVEAIVKAMKYGSGIYQPEIAEKIAVEIEQHAIEFNETLTVKRVENEVYKKLTQYGCQDTAKAYESYRAVQAFKRQVNTTDDSILGNK